MCVESMNPLWIKYNTVLNYDVIISLMISGWTIIRFELVILRLYDSILFYINTYIDSLSLNSVLSFPKILRPKRLNRIGCPFFFIDKVSRSNRWIPFRKAWVQSMQRTSAGIWTRFTSTFSVPITLNPDTSRINRINL